MLFPSSITWLTSNYPKLLKTLKMWAEKEEGLTAAVCQSLFN